MTNSGSPYVKVAGMDVERDALRIAEAVHAYDPNLRVQYLESEAKLGEPPFRILETGRDGLDRVAMTAWVLDDRLLDRVVAADTKLHDIQALLDASNAKAKAEKNYRYEEKMREAAEISRSILSSPKDVYTVGKLKFRN